MSPPVFLDANVPIYAAGKEHPKKEPCALVLNMAAEHPLSFVTDAERCSRSFSIATSP